MPLWCIAAPRLAPAQDAGRSFQVIAEPAKATVGDSITLRFRVRLHERDLLTDTVPRPAGELPPGVRVLSLERLQRRADRIFEGRGVVALYRTGIRDLPRFGLPWIQIVSGRRGTLVSEAPPVEIVPVLGAGNPTLRDIREPLPPSGPGAILALTGAVGAGLVAWLAARRLRRRAPAVGSEMVPAPSSPSVGPYETTLLRLQEIEASQWPVRGEVARHYAAVADALRDYLEAAVGLPARERTTTELLWSLPPRLCESGLRRRVQEVLGEADMVKFARRRPNEGEARAYLDAARDLLARWHQAAGRRAELDAVR